MGIPHYFKAQCAKACSQLGDSHCGRQCECMQDLHALANTQLQPKCMIKHQNIQLLNLNDTAFWRDNPTFTAAPQPECTMPLDRWFVESLTHAPRLHCLNLDRRTKKDRQSAITMDCAVQTGLCIVTFTNVEATQTLVHARQEFKLLPQAQVWNG